MDIAVWLRSLSLEQYEAAFRENAIDADVLHDLTDQDLEKLGVLLGHRRRLLRAIAALDGTVATSSALAPLQVKPSPAAEAAGERRHVTVMFCDLVGSTSIAAQLDAEEWRDLVGAYLDAASAAVTEMGGKVAKKLGDGLMALFGYPVAQENDAERAARAALSIQRALAELNRKNAGSGKPALNARIGIESGPVVVDAAGEIYGDAPNIAARVQALAEPGDGRGDGAGAAPGRRSVRRRGARQPRTQRRAGAGDAVPARAGERRRTPRGAAPSHAARRSRRGNRHADAALGAGAAGRRAIGADRRRAWLGQVAPDRGISCPAARDAAHLGRMELFAAPAEHAAAPDRRMGPPALRRRRRARRAASRGPGEYAGAGQARPGGECPVARAAPRHSAAAGTRADFGARGIAAPATGGADQLG